MILSGLRKGQAEVSGVLGVLARRMTRRQRPGLGTPNAPPPPRPLLPLAVRVSEKDAGALLHVEDGGLPLFHIAHYTRTFERGAECMHEIRAARCGDEVGGRACSMHIVVGAQGLRTMTVEQGWGGGSSERGKMTTDSSEEGGAAATLIQHRDAGEITAFEGAGEIELRTI